MKLLTKADVSRSSAVVAQQKLVHRPCCHTLAIVCVIVQTLAPEAEAASLRATTVTIDGASDGILGGAFAGGFESFLQSASLNNQVPPAAYWAAIPTPAPPSLGPGPYPNLMWVEQKPLPLPATTPPVFEQCHGCHCMFVFPDDFTVDGVIADKYSCLGGAPTQKVPHIKWVGQPGVELTTEDGKACPKCSSFAVTVEDLDWPNGIGEINNQVHSIFWAVNIPSNETEINDANAFGDTKVVVGYNPQGVQGLETPCPSKGKHRYKVTLWSVNGYLGSDAAPFDPKSTPATVKASLESMELARATFFASLTSLGR